MIAFGQRRDLSHGSPGKTFERKHGQGCRKDSAALSGIFLDRCFNRLVKQDGTLHQEKGIILNGLLGPPYETLIPNHANNNRLQDAQTGPSS